MQETLYVWAEGLPSQFVVVEYEDAEWMEEARRGISLASKMVADVSKAESEEDAAQQI